MATWQHARGPTKCHKLWGLRGLGCPGSRTYIYALQPPFPVIPQPICDYVSSHESGNHHLMFCHHTSWSRLHMSTLVVGFVFLSHPRFKTKYPPFLHFSTQNIKGQIFYLTPSQFQLRLAGRSCRLHNFEFSTNIWTRMLIKSPIFSTVAKCSSFNWVKISLCKNRPRELLAILAPVIG